MKRVDYKLLGEKIRKLREENNITRKEFAEKLAIKNEKSVAMMEQGRRKVKVIEFLFICKLFDISPDELVEGALLTE